MAKADVTKEDVIEFIANMSVLELSELVKEMEEKFGVSAAAPVAMMAAGPGDGAGGAAAEEEQTELHKMLSNVDGVIRIEFVTKKKLTDATDVHPREKKQAAETSEHLPVLLPTNQLFQPLLADPRWPHFSASFQRYINDDQLRNVASTNFGESFGIYRFRGP